MAIYLVGLAQMTGVDLDSEITRKLTENAARTYQPTANGTLVKAAMSDGRQWLRGGARSSG